MKKFVIPSLNFNKKEDKQESPKIDTRPKMKLGF